MFHTYIYAENQDMFKDIVAYMWCIVESKTQSIPRQGTLREVDPADLLCEDHSRSLRGAKSP